MNVQVEVSCDYEPNKFFGSSIQAPEQKYLKNETKERTEWGWLAAPKVLQKLAADSNSEAWDLQLTRWEAYSQR